MRGVSDLRSAEFFEWELLGSGRRLWPHAVALDPPLPTFRRKLIEEVDDGRRPTALSTFVRKLSDRLAPVPPSSPRAEEENAEEVPRPFDREAIVAIPVHAPPSQRFDREAYAGFFAAVSVASDPIAFEIVGTAERIGVQFAVSPEDEGLVRAHLAAFFPEVALSEAPDILATAWDERSDGDTVVVDFALGREFLVPLGTRGGDPFLALVGAMSILRDDEAASFQVLFSPASPKWNDAIVRAVSHGDGSALFVNAPEILPAAKEKSGHALFAAVLRIAVRSDALSRSWEIACAIGGALGVFGSVRGNELVPLPNDEYAGSDHELDLLARRSRRSGMILNAIELAGFVHLPSSDVKSERLRRDSCRTKAAPAAVACTTGLRLGTNEHLGTVSPVALTHEARARHIHIVGASGTGKSTLLFNLIRQDVENGEGVSVLDPHGDLIDKILSSVPERRVKDVVLVDPSDDATVVPFNILAASSDSERNLLASDLVSIFRRLSSSWGDQLNSVLHNALLAFLESDMGGTLHDVRRFLIEPSYRTEFLKTVRDPDVAYYWRKAFPLLTGNRSVGPIITRLDTFLSPKAVRYMVAHGENRIDFRDIMDSGKIFLAKLSQGSIGKENSHLLGSLFVAKIQAEAMSRQRQEESSRRYHFLYADEFHEFLTPSLAECLSGVRKYRLGLVLAHQEMRQVERDQDVASSLLNAHTRIVFRVSERDARALEGGFSAFGAPDLQNLSIGQALCRVERAEWDFNLSVEKPAPESEREATNRRQAVVEASRKAHGISRRVVEEALRRAAEKEIEPIRDASPRNVAKMVAQSVEMAPEPVPSKVAAPASGPTSLGKGGAQHKAIQERVKTEAESLGFCVVLEKEVLGGIGQIDAVLTRGELAIACEISVENTIDYEIGNVAKCLKAGYRNVAVVSTTEEKLAKLKSAVTNSLGAEAAKITTYHLPDAFFAWLRMVEAPPPNPDEPVRTHGGRVVKRKTTSVSPEEAKTREAQALEIMARMMQQTKSR